MHSIVCAPIESWLLCTQKPANVLINANCAVKIADFGLARVLIPVTLNPAPVPAVLATDAAASPSADDAGPPPPPPQLSISHTTHVVSRHFRAPEVILKDHYDLKIDVWSAGCIFAELLSFFHAPGHTEHLFPGRFDSSFGENVPFNAGSPNTKEHDQLNGKEATTRVRSG